MSKFANVCIDLSEKENRHTWQASEMEKNARIDKKYLFLSLKKSKIRK